MSRLVSHADLPDWLQPHLRWITFPSWMVSVAMHALVVVVMLFVARLPGCQPDMAGDGGESFREVGLYVRPAAVPEPPQSDPEDLPETTVSSNAIESTQAPEAVPDQPPAPLHLPELRTPSVIGAQGPPRTSTSVDPRLNTATAGAPPTRQASSGGGSTAFMGIEDAGKRFVYLIDSSSSMADYGAFRVAKSELLASLERLTEAQQFQVIFANSDQQHVLKAGRFDLFFGTDSQRLEVRLQIAGIGTDSGTNHFKGLEVALTFNPDVIYFLSDAGEPYLTAKQLDDIRRRNRGGARIHCIEFGRGPPLQTDGRPAPNFLTRLAAQNDGRYLYRDVTQFSGR